jgi:hypothetical protein
MKRMFFIGLQRPNFSHGRHIQNGSGSESDWLTNNRRGFDADKFCKFVAMFDSDEARELAQIGITLGGRKSYRKTPEYAAWARRNHCGTG